MPALSGHGGWAQLGQNYLRASQWVVRVTAQEVDVTTCAEGGSRQLVTRLPRCEFTLDAFWDPVDNVFQDRFAVVAGGNTTGVRLGLKQAGGLKFIKPAWSFPACRWLHVEMKATVRDAIRFHLVGVATPFNPLFGQGPVTIINYPGVN